MSIDLAQTPTIQAVATADESSLVVDLEQRAAAAVRQAESQPEVIAADESERKAAQRLAELTRAEMTEALNRGWSERDSRVAMLLQEERAGVAIKVPVDAIQAVFDRDG